MIVVVVTAVLAAPVGATTDDMARLPVSSRFLCTNCHILADPQAGSADLNDFGFDFLGAGRLWTSELAQLDSDDDGCTNGAEIGDVDGNNQLDDGIEFESSNPGLTGDCSSAAWEHMSWSELKDLFNGS